MIPLFSNNIHSHSHFEKEKRLIFVEAPKDKPKEPPESGEGEKKPKEGLPDPGEKNLDEAEKKRITELQKKIDETDGEDEKLQKEIDEIKKKAAERTPSESGEKKDSAETTPKNEYGRMMDDFNGLKKDQDAAIKQRDEAQAKLDKKNPPPTPEEKEKAEADVKAANDKLREISDKKFQIALEFIVKLITDPKSLFNKGAGSPEDPNKPGDPNAPSGGPDKPNPLRDQIVAKGFQSPTELRDSVSKAEGDADKTLQDKSRDLKTAETSLGESISRQGAKNNEVNKLKASLASAPSEDAKKSIQANLDTATAELKALDENVTKQTEAVAQLKTQVEQAQKAVTQLKEDREKLDSLVTMTDVLEKDFGPISISLDADGGASLRFEDATKSDAARQKILEKTRMNIDSNGVLKLTPGGIRVLEKNVTGTSKPPATPPDKPTTPDGGKPPEKTPAKPPTAAPELSPEAITRQIKLLERQLAHVILEKTTMEPTMKNNAKASVVRITQTGDGQFTLAINLNMVKADLPEENYNKLKNATEMKYENKNGRIVSDPMDMAKLNSVARYIAQQVA